MYIDITGFFRYLHLFIFLISFQECLSNCCLMPTQQFLAISWQEQVNFRRNDDEVRYVLDQQSVDRHVTPPGHIILILSQPVFALSPKYCVLGGEATNTNFIVFGLTRLGLEPTIICT